MGFQSTLAGILLAAEFARPEPLFETITQQIDMLSTFPERPSRLRAKTLSPQCLCLDEDFRRFKTQIRRLGHRHVLGRGQRR
ncbi:MAG: hypothetical protein M3N82_02030 [Pseudomonadota bacterium]|nr:hypothetical protein [Pseudomonadota bacterium]